MASPFSIFRRNQRIMLAVVGIGAMIAFVFLQPLMDYVGRGQAPDDPVVVETKYGSFNESQLVAMQQARELVDLFLRQTSIETIDAQIAKGQFDPRSRDSMIDNWYRQCQGQLMRRSKPGPEGAAIETLILAQRAKELGMVVSDRAINNLLMEVTLDSLSSDVVQGIVANLQANRRISMGRLFEALRTEMLASNLSQLFQNSLSDIPPAQKFEYYQRLNRRAKAEIVPLAVVDFTSQVENPDDDVLRPFYEKYKNRLPSAASPEPGFKEPRRAAFQYFKADFAKFTEAMKPEVTDEEIADYYEKNKAQFIQLDLPEKPGDKPEDESTEEKPQSDEETKPEPDDESKAPADEKPAEEPSPDEPQTEQPKEEPSGEQPQEESPAEEPKANPATSEDESPQPEASSSVRGATMRLVSTAASLQDAAQDESGGQPSDEGPAIEAPGDAPSTDEPGEKADTPAEKAEAAESTEEPTEKPAGEQAESSDDQPVDRPAAEPDTASDSAPPSEPGTDDTPPEPKYEPLEKVADQIRDSIAGGKAAERIAEILDELQAEMRNYADELDIYRTRKDSDEDVQPPAPFPFAELAKKYDIEAKELPLVSAAEASGEDIGGVYRLVQDRSSQFGVRTEPFAEFAFSKSLPTYRPSVVGDNEGNSYLFWKTEEVASYVPEFDKAHDKVLAAWKMIKARPLAVKRAEELAAQAQKSGKPLKELYEADSGLKVIETDSFSWMTGGSVPMNPMGGGPVRLSQIDGVEHIGPEFMEAVFDLPAGGVGVAQNNPQDTVYVVRLAEYEQTVDELRDGFAKERPALYMTVATPELRDMYQAWIESLEKQADVHWHRRADVARRGRGEDDTSQM